MAVEWATPTDPFVPTRHDAADCDLLLCLVNPYKIPHKSVMRSIELLGEHVIPHLA